MSTTQTKYLTPIDSLDIRPPLRVAEDGRVVRLGDTRVSLRAVILAWQAGDDVHTICNAYAHVSRAAIEAALELNARQPQAVQAYLHWEQSCGDALRARVESMAPSRAELMARLKAQ